MELSSLAASVTLWPLLVHHLGYGSGSYMHQRVWLLLLLENGSGHLIDLMLVSTVSSHDASRLALSTYVFLLASGWVTDGTLDLNVKIMSEERTWQD